mmetsp:Transcript_29603/g.76480  ORF Transcript_29603/g.76480 Transcript_29603/m.76480 type:complete len:103 (-) Transcript_29603:3598-3906(-)
MEKGDTNQKVITTTTTIIIMLVTTIITVAINDQAQMKSSRGMPNWKTNRKLGRGRRGKEWKARVQRKSQGMKKRGRKTAMDTLTCAGRKLAREEEIVTTKKG